MIITFDKSLSQEILNFFNKSIDKDGSIIDLKTGRRVLSREGEVVTLDEFAGVTKGSEVYLKSDILSLINYIENKNEDIRRIDQNSA